MGLSLDFRGSSRRGTEGRSPRGWGGGGRGAAGGRGAEPAPAEGADGLAAPRLAHERDRLPFPHVVGTPIHGADHSRADEKVGREVFDLEEHSRPLLQCSAPWREPSSPRPEGGAHRTRTRLYVEDGR